MLTQILSSSNRLPSLDFLRGLAVTVVFLTHFGIFDLNAIGVDLFFVLSGHLVSLSLWSTLSKSESKRSYLIFFIKRLFRIIPAYYTFLVLGYLLALLLISDISPADVPLLREAPQYFFFYRNYGGPPSRWSMEHLWSLSVEEQFYWILPSLIAFFALRHSQLEKRFIYAAIILLSAGIGFKAQAMFTDFAEWPTYTHNRLDAFGWGICITLLSKGVNGTNHLFFNHKGVLLAGATILASSLIIFAPLPELIMRTLGPLGWFLVILGIYHSKSNLYTPFKLMSFFSYGIYLWHFLFVIPTHHYFGKGWAGFLVYFLATMMFAVLSTLFIERPSLQLRERFLKKAFPKNTAAEVFKIPGTPIP